MSFNINYGDALEHLEQMLRYHKIFRSLGLTKYICPFLKPKIPVLILDDLSSLYSYGNLINSEVKLILERYSIYWLDNQYAKIIFVTSKCGTFTSLRRLSGWDSRLRLCSFDSFDQNQFIEFIKKNPRLFNQEIKIYQEFYNYFGGDLRTLEKFRSFEVDFKSNRLLEY